MIPASSDLRRSLVGFVVAPPLGAGTYSILITIAFSGLRLATGEAELPAGLVGIPIAGLLLIFMGLLGTFFGSPLAYFGMLLVGLPSWFLLRYTNKESGIAYAFLGFLGGGVAMPKIWGGSGSDPWELWRIHGAIAGCIVLTIFWKIARRAPATEA
jgi:hypothetical protein